MNNKKAIERLRNDEDYYGEFGKTYLSNSDISALLNNPLEFKKPSPPNPAFLIGGYFHTTILEPHKLDKYKIVKSSTRNTKAYKEIAGEDICLLEHEADAIQLMREKVLDNDLFRDLIQEGAVEYELPGITELEGMQWKGKADIVNHEEGLVIDLKTTGDIEKFRWSASRYNYDSQAYIYSKLFGYEMLFIVIDKNTHQIGIFDCSPEFYSRGADKVQQAAEQYKLFFQNPDFDPTNHFINKTL